MKPVPKLNQGQFDIAGRCRSRLWKISPTVRAHRDAPVAPRDEVVVFRCEFGADPSATGMENAVAGRVAREPPEVAIAREVPVIIFIPANVNTIGMPAMPGLADHYRNFR